MGGQPQDSCCCTRPRVSPDFGSQGGAPALGEGPRQTGVAASFRTAAKQVGPSPGCPAPGSQGALGVEYSLPGQGPGAARWQMAVVGGRVPGLGLKMGGLPASDRKAPCLGGGGHLVACPLGQSGVKGPSSPLPSPDTQAAAPWQAGLSLGGQGCRLPPAPPHPLPAWGRRCPPSLSTGGVGAAG